MATNSWHKLVKQLDTNVPVVVEIKSYKARDGNTRWVWVARQYTTNEMLGTSGIRGYNTDQEAWQAACKLMNVRGE